jgi:glycosyltransferase involved in cell wall biosynthesis
MALRIALVHDYLNQMGGAEKLLLTFHDLFPTAPIYTSIYARDRVDPRFRHMDIRTSFMQRLPLVKKHHQPFLPLFPLAFEQLDLRAYDLVISDSSAFAKGIVTRPEALHICYCHTPMRWAWNYEDYVERERLGRAARMMLAPTIAILREWDYTTAARVDYFVANSPNVAARIAKYYRRDSVYIPPPVDTSQFEIAPEQEDYFLVVSRLIPYKRVDLAVSAFNELGLPLHIIGSGRDEHRLRRMAGPTIRFMGRTSDQEMRRQLAACRAFIFPGEDDFGLTPLEAAACGRPVIAYGAGGALHTIVAGKTGIFFQSQDSASLGAAVSGFRDDRFDPTAIRQHALTFDTRQFRQRFLGFVESKIAEHPTLASLANIDYRGSRAPATTASEPGWEPEQQQDGEHGIMIDSLHTGSGASLDEQR